MYIVRQTCTIDQWRRRSPHHRIKGDPYNQHENDLTEQLVHQAIDEDNQDAIHGGNGCNRSSIGKLSDDQRILKVRRLM